MHQDLQAGKTTALTQAITGLGGVGKTQLALEYVYRHASDYDGIWWLRAEQPATLAGDYAALATPLGIDLMADQEALNHQVRHALSTRERFLLVFDNATTPESVEAYLPQGTQRHVIITTRTQYWPGASTQDVEVLTEPEAIEFLLKRTGQADREQAKSVATRLGYLPLALDQAAAYTVQCKKSLAAYAALLEKHGLKLFELKQSQPHQYQRSVNATWTLAFDEVTKRNPGAAALLNLCSFLAPDAIALADLAQAAGEVPEPLKSVLADELERDQAKAELLNFSLSHVDGDTMTVHRLVQEVTRTRLDHEAQDQWLSAALRAVSAL